MPGPPPRPLFKLKLGADGQTIELVPCVPHLASVNIHDELDHAASSDSPAASAPAQPSEAARQSTAEIDAWEASYFEGSEPAIEYAETWENSNHIGKGKSGHMKRVVKRPGEFQYGFTPPPVASCPPSRWPSLVALLMRRHGVWLSKRAPIGAPKRKRLWSVREVKKWENRHGARELPLTPWEARLHGVLLRQEARKKGKEICNHRPNASNSTAVVITRPPAVASDSQCGAANPQRFATPAVDPWADLRAPVEAVLDASLDPDLVMALQLGLDQQTFRQLRALERRDIRPEDYDLLGQLDASITPATLTSKQLKLFPIETYQVVTGAKQNTNPISADINMDFWRLPLPPLEDTDWGSPEPENSRTVEVFMPIEVCGVCLVDFEAGDVLRKLTPCGHRFHRQCIDRWLLEAATTCPVDNLDLRQD
eukprot:gnl/MRDRNA2_/MRDRNA2_29301_c0_seq1.p1 gnl/MRDRNA2_/MRDRNA2_29301_c0~~gnl/MRDRNA2_/MRDRNA2_29301_c0_seq1.p1  ORF type:complete len:424 (+),score=70.02 gnl/MRDRNA2_/MRDRNA2_29301_c0_seq1:109-1380(+)